MNLSLLIELLQLLTTLILHVYILYSFELASHSNNCLPLFLKKKKYIHKSISQKYHYELSHHLDDYASLTRNQSKVGTIYLNRLWKMWEVL